MYRGRASPRLCLYVCVSVSVSGLCVCDMCLCVCVCVCVYVCVSVSETWEHARHRTHAARRAQEWLVCAVLTACPRSFLPLLLSFPPSLFPSSLPLRLSVCCSVSLRAGHVREINGDPPEAGGQVRMCVCIHPSTCVVYACACAQTRTHAHTHTHTHTYIYNDDKYDVLYCHTFIKYTYIHTLTPGPALAHRVSRRGPQGQ